MTALRKWGTITLFFVSLSLVPRIIYWIFVRNCSAFAPDESTYVHMYRSFLDGNFDRTQTWFEGSRYFFYFLFNSIRILTISGINDLFAFRISSVVTSILFQIVIATIVLKLNNVKYSDGYAGAASRKVFFQLSILLFPDFLFWTSHALRESWVMLGLSLCILGVVDITKTRKYNSGIVWYFLGMLLLSQTKLYLFAFMLAATALTILICIDLRQIEKKPISVISIALFIVSIFFLYNHYSDRGIPEYSSSQPLVGSSQLFASTTSNQIAECMRRNTGSLFLYKLIDSAKSEGNLQSKTESKIISEKNRDRGIRNVGNGFMTFLFKPIVGFSPPGFSYSIYSLTNVFWYLLYFLCIRNLFSHFKSSSKPFPGLILVVTFCSIFLFYSSISEINLGTIIRHKLILFPFLVYLITVNEVKHDNR